jgi:hypothetical protein
MNPERPNDFVIDGGLYSRNRAKYFPPEELLKYMGQEVAFSADGTRIVIHGENGEDFTTLWNRLKERGINPSSVVWDYIPRPEE